MMPGDLSDQSFQRIVEPFAAEEMAAVEVSPLVNNARLDDERCCAPVDAGPLKMVLKDPVKQDDQQTLGI
jgi:hypothetical protein